MSRISTQSSAKVVPAHLSFLAIYNPSLGNTDETLRDQIVYYYSQDDEAHKHSAERSRASANGAGSRNHEAQLAEEDEEQENEKLRQVGLAQGMVDFVK